MNFAGSASMKGSSSSEFEPGMCASEVDTEQMMPCVNFITMRKALFAVLVAAPALAQDAVAHLDELYLRRDDPKAYEEADKLLTSELKSKPDDYGLLWRAARLHVYAAISAGNDSRKKVEA